MPILSKKRNPIKLAVGDHDGQKLCFVVWHLIIGEGSNLLTAGYSNTRYRLVICVGSQMHVENFGLKYVTEPSSTDRDDHTGSEMDGSRELAEPPVFSFC